jgi:hypothetical protein
MRPHKPEILDTSLKFVLNPSDFERTIVLTNAHNLNHFTYSWQNGHLNRIYFVPGSI